MFIVSIIKKGSTMNKNIEVISENLWAVNFQFVKLGYIKELTFKNENSAKKLAVLSDDGKYIFNKEVNCSLYIPFIQAIMTLNNVELMTKQGFCKVIRILFPKIKEWDDKKIMSFICSDSSIIGNWTIYQNLCVWEIDRRKVEKTWNRKHPIMAIYKKIRKGVKDNGKHWNIN